MEGNSSQLVSYAHPPNTQRSVRRAREARLPTAVVEPSSLALNFRSYEMELRGLLLILLLLLFKTITVTIVLLKENSHENNINRCHSPIFNSSLLCKVFTFKKKNILMELVFTVTICIVVRGYVMLMASVNEKSFCSRLIYGIIVALIILKTTSIYSNSSTFKKNVLCAHFILLPFWVQAP